MNAIITKKEEFSSKLGIAFVKLCYLLSDGTAGELFMKKEQYSAYNFDEENIFNKEEIEKLFSTVEDGVVKIMFDSKGQCVAIGE